MNREATAPRACADCGCDATVLVETSGALICRECLRQTTQVPKHRQPATPRLDAHLAAIEKREREQAAAR